MSVATDKQESLTTQEPVLPTSYFVRFMRVLALSTLAVGAIEVALGAVENKPYLYELGTLTLGLGLVAHLAGLQARAGRRPAGLYGWSIGSAVIVTLIPLVVNGMLPFIMIGAVVNLLLAVLFLSPHLRGRAVFGVTIFVLIPTLLELWQPRSHHSVMTDLPLIPLVLYPGSVVITASLINLFGETLLKAVKSAKVYAKEVEQSRAVLLKQTDEMRETTAKLALRSEELEKLNQNWQITSQQAERRASQLAASAQVARAVSQVRDLDQLLSQVTHFIGDAFGYYHVGIFIVDELGRFAVLHAANSEGGQRMLARSHKLAVGTQGIVGYVTGTGQPRVALDVGADAVHFDNPDLSQTRSEMALPLRVGEQIFGALDVQSTQGGAFTEEDVAVLSALADQIAIAIENARLFAQTRAALQEAQETQAHYLRQAWEQLLSTLQATSYEYHVSGTKPLGDAPLPEIEQVLRQQEVVTLAPPSPTGGSPAPAALAVPIKLHDELIGVIDLHEADADRHWTEDDLAIVTAVADQVALALENVRLFSQTQQRARREQLIAQIAAKMRAAPDVDSILRTTVHEIRRALGTSHGVIRLRVGEVPVTVQEAGIR